MIRFRSLTSRPRAWVWAFFCALALAMIAGLPIARTKAALQGEKNRTRLVNLDVRVNGGNSGLDLLQARPAALARAQSLTQSMRSAADAQKAQRVANKITFSSLTGSPEVVEGQSSALTPPSSGRSGYDIVLGYLRANAAVYGLSSKEIDGLHFIGESVSPSGLRMVRFEQVVNGVPIFQSETRAIIDRNGSLVRTLGLLVPGTDYAESLANVIPATRALASAMGAVGIALNVDGMTVSDLNAEGTKATVTASEEVISGEVASKLVYFPLAPGVLIPAWSQITFTSAGGDYYSIVDAQSGVPLWRKNIRADASAHDARFRVYVQADGTTPSDNPAPHSPTTNTVGLGTQYPEIAPTIVSMHTAMDATASPNGWIDDCPAGGCTAAQTQTIGNNVHAYMDAQGGANNNLPDTNAAFVLDGAGKPTGNPDANGRNRDFLGTTPRDFQTGFLPPPQGGNPEVGQTATGNGSNGTLAIDQFRRGVVTHLFYVANWYHDQLFKLGFNEAAGNFQQTNFSGMGVGNDRVLAEAQDNQSVNNANFSTPPDGTSGRAQMFRFTGPTIDRDGDLDQEVLMHELTHGTSNRLIGNGAGLVWDVGSGMGEGWSDFFALSLLNNTNADNPDGLYASGAYATYKLQGIPFLDNYVYGIRRFPYTTDNTINPMTWADVDQTTNNLSGGIAPDPLGFNIGGAGEVHNSGEIWCLTLWEVRSRVINDPAGANGDVPTGNHTMLQLITDSLKMTPANPTFLDARDAIIAADGATHSFANEQSIWAGFADRGLGYNAAAPLAVLFTPVSPTIGIKESFLVPFLDKGTTTFSDVGGGNGNGSIDPGEQLTINVPLKNPWHNTTKGVASATATLTSPTPGVTIVSGSSTYPAIAAQATVNGTPFTVRIASSVTCGQLLNFTVTTNSSLGASTFDFSYRVGTPSGTGAPITYTRTESPALTVLDNRPVGVTSTINITDDYEIADLNMRVNNITHTFPGDVVVGLRGPTGYGTTPIAFIGAAVGAGNGDNIVNMVIDDQATGDILLATNAQAPYTASWKPLGNSPTWPLIGFPPQDAVGQLSRFNGTSPKGDWKLVVSDQAPQDAGTFSGWSLIITPVNFTCAPFTCAGPTIVCPANITKANDPNQCGAVATFTTPTATSSCATPGPVTCAPATGSFFPKGTTTVTCSSTDDQAHTGSCSFTVTVNDTQPPTIVCPPNVTKAGAPTCPVSTTQTVTYAAPTSSDNCPGVVTVCSPPSGSPFPVGTTTVTCTATDASNNTATCSFTVAVFALCLQDDSNPGNVVLFTPSTGAYRYCCGGVTVAQGTGNGTVRGCTVQIDHNAPDRRLQIIADLTVKRGTASLQLPPGSLKCTISDRNMNDNSCVCGVPAP